MNTLEPGVLKIHTYSDFAPVCSTRKDGTPWGTDISFLEKFAAHHGLTTNWVVKTQFDGIWQNPGKHSDDPDSCDIAAAGITPTIDRKNASPGTVWSEVYFHVRRSLLIRAVDKSIFRTIRDFGGKKVAVTRNSTADLDIQMRNPAHATVEYASGQDEAVRLLLKGEIDAFGEGDVSNKYLAGTTTGLLVIDEHEFEGRSEPFSFPVRATSGIIDALNAWITTKAEGEYLDIEELKPSVSEKASGF